MHQPWAFPGSVAAATQPDENGFFPSLLGSIPVTVEYAATSGFAQPVSVWIGGKSASLLDDACHFSPCQLKAWEREAQATHVARCGGNAFDDTEHCAAVALGAFIDRMNVARAAA
ncbi:hypothetical protein [Azohydromonas aeria]|uniref:hypothetical protein n=1 Tax=Azohydromonas aeria TaxID=2590212 RepID=UPI0012FBC8BB|nr:hypothetical protein [Azohydromonas aeria]